MSRHFYDRNCDRLFHTYSAFDADDIHGFWAKKHLRNRNLGVACDIGAGSGRDANWLAEAGWEVVAVEPSKLFELGKKNSSSRVTWLDDSLPNLKRLRALGQRFDLVLVSAVWQHVSPNHRKRVFRIFCELLNPSGLLVISLKRDDRGEDPEQRGLHAVTSEELQQLANRYAVGQVGDYRNRPDLARKHVRWDWHVFEIPDDGTGNLPLMRHIIINDSKSASYKLGLLRTLIKLAETAPGIVIKRTDDYVEVPFGAVGLLWIKLYYPLLIKNNLRQARGESGHSFAKEAFYRLADYSIGDISLGYRFDQDRANVIRRAIGDACLSIRENPAHFITYPGSSDRQVFECDYFGVKRHSGEISLTKEYLSMFGTFRVPSQLWQTLGQYACWLDPAIVKEWQQLIQPWQRRQDVASIDERAFEWTDQKRDTGVVANRAREIRDRGFPLSCVWSAKHLDKRSKLEIDHCFPWSRWPNNDLWNLLPTRKKINQEKSDKLPSADALAKAHDRIIDWWKNAWVGSPLEEQFFVEADYSLPGLSGDRPSLDEIHQAARHQRVRLKQDQQIPEWPFLSEAVVDP